MTREEAKEVFINRGYVNVKGGTVFDGDKWRQSVEVITEWLKKQPCEDAISRQAAIDAVEKAKAAMTTDGEIYVAKINAEMNIQQLPSVSTENPNMSEIKQKCDRINSLASVLPYAPHREIQELLCEIMDLCKAESEDKE